MKINFNNKHRITQRKKDANDKQWYKDQIDLLDTRSFAERSIFDFGGTTSYKRKRTSYNLFNNICNVNELAYVTQPYGEDIGELPANFANRDIVSGKIKVLLGMEMKMPFSWSVVAVNEEATTRKEQYEADLIKDFVIAEVMKPVREQLETQAAEQAKGRKLTFDEQQQIKQGIEEELKARTPDEVRRYMTREHQDPAEALARQLLEYLLIEKRIAFKFNKGFKHSCLSGEEIYWIGIRNGEPDMQAVNPLYFDYDKSPDLDFIEDGEWAVNELRMSPSEVVANFGSQLTNDEIDKIYAAHSSPERGAIVDSDFTFNTDFPDEPFTVRIIHANWKSLRKIGFLTYFSEATGSDERMVVDENYKFNEEQGDISIRWEWIPEAHEGYKIMDDIYVYCRPVPGQHKDLDNLYKCKLSYFGAATDNLNSPITSPMDRMKSYQYLYNIIIYRMELLMASDKGKIIAANINSIPKSSGLSIEEVTYFMEANKILWMNPNEEGNRGSGDITNMVKELDMSLISDIKKYIELAEYIKAQAGYAIGVTPQMEAQIGANDAVSNTRQNLVQASYIIQPYFELHNTVKANCLNALLDSAKVAYSEGQPRKLTYILDDMTQRMLTIDQELLPNSTYGLYVANSAKASDAKQAVENLSQAALQNQQADLLDIIKIIKADSVSEAEETLEMARARSAEQLQQAEQMKIQAAEKQAAREDQAVREGREHEKAMIILKEGEARKTRILEQQIESMGFNEDKDMNRNQVPDVLEIEKFGVDTQLKTEKQQLDREKFEHQKEVDRDKLENEKEKIEVSKKKKVAS